MLPQRYVAITFHCPDCNPNATYSRCVQACDVPIGSVRNPNTPTSPGRNGEGESMMSTDGPRGVDQLDILTRSLTAFCFSIKLWSRLRPRSSTEVEVLVRRLHSHSSIQGILKAVKYEDNYEGRNYWSGRGRLGVPFVDGYAWKRARLYY